MTHEHQSVRFFMPAEWASQQAVWMVWPYRGDNWREQATPARQIFARVAEAIAMTTPVFMAVGKQHWEAAKALLDDRITLVEIESDDAWARDTGPTIVFDQQGQRCALDWRFNAWGGELGGLYPHWQRDQAVASQIAAYHELPCHAIDLVMEGGAIHTDGEGTLLVTRECLLSPNRNPTLTQAEIEAQLHALLGVEKIIWLPLGVYKDETDGHIDNMCCFVRPGEVVLSWTYDQDDPQYARSQAAFDTLKRCTDARGRTLKIWKLPMPGPLYATEQECAGISSGEAVERSAGERLAASYVNYLITNHQIVFPLLDERTDSQALAIFREMYPDHVITPIEGREILLGGGNIHCITQQIPASDALNASC
ncbi:agmatine deiminase [Carnimonas nigrificans]|uniref:agmatine deiminase n=1 Tax=Carnimonas nigrificans TaxID=64323 RepID=UPI00046FC315|nr:agmatine deiminase [Carnimonas nigrificans]